MFSFLKLAVAALVLAAPSVSAFTESEAQAQFTSFVKTYNKQYAHDEFFPRYTIFKQNLQKIEEHNAGSHTFTQAINEFSDMSSSEFTSKMNGYKMTDRSYLRSLNTVQLDTTDLPTSVDWTTTAGVVSAVKNQGQCGSCWSFSTTGSVEGAWAIAGNSPVSLSEQQLMDCSSAQGDNSCEGGLMDDAFQFIMANKGICTEASYPYKAVDESPCQTTCSDVAHITSYADVTKNNTLALMAAVALGPVSVAIEADKDCFQGYSGGVMSDTGCGDALDHGVLLVGYGHDAASGLDFWKVKNSWGPTWGEAGYIRMVRTVSTDAGECGIQSAASYPIVGASKSAKAKNAFRF